MENIPNETDISVIFRVWEEGNSDPHHDPIPILNRLAELFEQETENYLKMDPDPFDERHPSRADPDCALGHMLKVIFRKDTFMNKLVNDYLRDNYYSRLGISGRNVRDLNVAACRLMLDITPGLETSAVFETPSNDALVNRLFAWAREAPEPLQTYATGLLAAAMEVQDIAVVFREKNSQMVPLMLKRLHMLQAQASEERLAAMNSSRPFAHLGSKSELKSDSSVSPAIKKKKIEASPLGSSKENGLMSPPHWKGGATTPLVNGEKTEKGVSENQGRSSQVKEQSEVVKTTPKVKSNIAEEDLPEGVGLLPPTTPGREPPWSRSPMMSPPHAIPQHSVLRSPYHTSSNLSECSNSSWAEMENNVIGSIQMYPLTIATQQMFILRYLTPMGEYQEFLSHVFEHNALELILKYLNIKESKDARLAFEALKYLASLLCHKKFSIEFINVQGLQRLLEVPRPSISATGVSICLYYLAYCEDAIERVCLLPQHTISDLVTYALWLLERSHDSGRCHATMFFGLSFQFRVILEEFDSQDGLRKLYNVVSTLPIMSTEEEHALNEDEECSARQIVRHVCVALKRYFEAHLCIRAEQVRRAHMRESEDHRHLQHVPSYKASKCTPEEIQEQIETLLQLMSFRANWAPVDGLLRLGGVTLLLQVIAFAYEWNYSGRAETVRSALDVLAICSVMPQVQLLFCEQVSMPDEGLTVAMTIILGAAEGEIVADPDVQRSALSVLINCVCAPIHRVGGTIARFSGSGYARKKANFRLSEDVILKMWDSVRSNNGIMILLTLMTVKTPITDADSIRALSCRALAGLARSETVKQIIGKLPLFTSGQLQNLMQNPILQDKRQEHVSFQKYALELLERVSGKTKPSGNEFEISLANIHRANVIAQTRIHFNDKQLYQLIHQHLLSRGMTESAAALLKEAGLPVPKPSLPLPLAYSYQRSSVPSVIRPRMNSSPLTSHHHLHRLPLSSPHLASLSSPCSSPSSVGSSGLTRGSASNILGSGASLNSPNSLANVSSQSAISEGLTPTPIKLSLASHRKESLYSNSPAGKSLQKQITYESPSLIASPMQKPAAAITATSLIPTAENQVTLDSIITEYLTNQHALCKNPMITCPQFNLFEPHKCPDPKAKRNAPLNFTLRHVRRSVYPSFDGPEGIRLDRRLVHSRFCPVRTFRPAEEDSFYTCCEFLPNGQQLVVGTYQGEVKLYNLQSAVQEEVSVQCHDSYIHHLQAHKNGKLLLSSCTWRQPLSALWSINNTTFESKYNLSQEEYVEFSKHEQDKLIATNSNDQTATVYDLETGKKILTLKPTVSNQYNKNKATFSPTNELVLSDGVVWDVNSGKEIHKLDKLNQNFSGLFHPNGLEIVSNTEVWDLRTFHLLRTVPTLDQCEIVFSPDGGVIYTFLVETENDDSKDAFESSFRTLDAHDYSPIATIDVKKNIHYIACNKYDTQICIVENIGMFDNVQESSVRVYDVGRRRADDDEAEDEEEDDDDDDDMDDDDASSEDNLNANGLMNLIDELDVDDQNEGDDDGEGGDDDDEDDDQGDAEDDSSSSSSDDSNDIEAVSIGSSDSDFLNYLG